MNRSRRTFLRVGSTAATAVAANLILPGSALAEAITAMPTLGEAGRYTGILVGAAVNVRALRESADYAELIRTQCRIVVAENAMKFGSLRPAANTFAFDDADFLVTFAERHGILVRGHNFVWHRQLPRWFEGYATKENAETILVEHIERLGGRYAGRIHSWDVCNEVIYLEDGNQDGLRSSPWYKLLGPGYIDTAFRTARRVDPHAMLCYNDYGIESDAPADAAKRKAVLHLLRGMQKRGVPIDAVGIQGHISAGADHVYGKGLRRFMADIQKMGLKLLVTEMDVNDRALDPAPAIRDQAVAARYQEFLKTALENTNMIALLTWGLTDRYTWLNGEDSRRDHLPERCLPFDNALKPVPAYDAELREVLRAPRRS